MKVRRGFRTRRRDRNTAARARRFGTRSSPSGRFLPCSRPTISSSARGSRASISRCARRSMGGSSSRRSARPPTPTRPGPRAASRACSIPRIASTLTSTTRCARATASATATTSRRAVRARGARPHPPPGRRAGRAVRPRRRGALRARARRRPHGAADRPRQGLDGLGHSAGAARARRRARRPHHDLAQSHGGRPAHGGEVRRAERRVRRVPARPDDGRGQDGRGARHRARDGRLGQGLPLHDEPGRRDGRRDRHGVPRGRASRQHGVLPISSDVPLPPVRQVISHQRGAARRGVAACCACATARPSWRASAT